MNMRTLFTKFAQSLRTVTKLTSKKWFADYSHSLFNNHTMPFSDTDPFLS